MHQEQILIVQDLIIRTLPEKLWEIQIHLVDTVIVINLHLVQDLTSHENSIPPGALGKMNPEESAINAFEETHLLLIKM
jgi:hypothetical protein